MIQVILTYLIVLSAFIYAGYKIVLVFIPGQNKKQNFRRVSIAQGNGCENCSGGCAIRNFNRENNLQNFPLRK